MTAAGLPEKGYALQSASGTVKGATLVEIYLSRQRSDDFETHKSANRVYTAHASLVFGHTGLDDVTLFKTKQKKLCFRAAAKAGAGSWAD